jgi:hypothetical protein
MGVARNQVPPMLIALHAVQQGASGKASAIEDSALQGAAHSPLHLDRPDAVLQANGDLLDRVDRWRQRRHVAAAARRTG